MRRTMLTLAGSAVILASSCATLGQLSLLVQPPRFERAADHQAEVRFMAPTTRAPLGGAAIRLWTKVSNPNAFGFTLATLRGTVFLDDARATRWIFRLDSHSRHEGRPSFRSTSS